MPATSVANNGGSMVALLRSSLPALLQHTLQPPKRDYRDAITHGRHQRCEQDQNAGPRLLFLMNIAAESSAKLGARNFCAAAADAGCSCAPSSKTGRAFRSPVGGSGW